MESARRYNRSVFVHMAAFLMILFLELQPVCANVLIMDKWNEEVAEVKLSQYYNQMFPLYCRGASDDQLRWEIPLEANRTGLVGFMDEGRTLVISVSDSGSDDVMNKLKGQYICRNLWTPSDYADVILTAPYTIEIKADPVQYVTKGHPANLSCHVSFQDARSSKNLLEFKKLSPVAPSIPAEFNKYEVYSPEGTSWNGDWKLGLMAVDHSDAGKYFCVATYEKFEATNHASFEVVVDEKPRFVAMIPKMIQVLRGDDFSINCVAVGLPIPEYSWKLTQSYEKLQNSERVTVMNNGTLSIKGVRVKDAGQYECHAENRAGQIMQTLMLQVNYKATLVPLEDKVVSETQQFSVKCVALEAQPPVSKFVWTLNGVAIFTGEEMRNSSVSSVPFEKVYRETVYEVQTFLGSNNIFSSTIWFKKLDRRYSNGIYSCEAHNDVGISSQSFNVDVQYRPYPSNGEVEENVKAFVGSDVAIDCEVDAKPSVAPSDFLWRLGTNLLSGYRNRTTMNAQITKNILYISKIEESFFQADKTFQCTVSNKVGEFTKVFRLQKLNKPGEVFFRGPFFDVTPTSARVQIQLPAIDDVKEEMTEYLFRIEEGTNLNSAGVFTSNLEPEMRPLMPVKYNDMTRIAEFLITDLRFSSEYIVSVAAVNRGGQGPFVEAPRPLMTADDRVPYQPIVGQLFTGPRNHTFKYKVTNNGGHPILSYRLTYFCGTKDRNDQNLKKMENTVQIAAGNQPGGIYSVDDLTPNSTCLFRLLAKNAKGNGPEFIWETQTHPDSGSKLGLKKASITLLLVAVGVTAVLLLALCLLMDFCMFISSPTRTGGCLAPVVCNLCCARKPKNVKPGYLRYCGHESKIRIREFQNFITLIAGFMYNVSAMIRHRVIILSFDTRLLTQTSIRPPLYQHYVIYRLGNLLTKLKISRS